MKGLSKLKRSISVLLAAVMVLTLLPAQAAYAEETDTAVVETVEAQQTAQDTADASQAEAASTETEVVVVESTEAAPEQSPEAVENTESTDQTSNEAAAVDAEQTSENNEVVAEEVSQDSGSLLGGEFLAVTPVDGGNKILLAPSAYFSGETVELDVAKLGSSYLPGAAASYSWKSSSNTVAVIKGDANKRKATIEAISPGYSKITCVYTNSGTDTYEATYGITVLGLSTTSETAVLTESDEELGTYELTLDMNTADPYKEKVSLTLDGGQTTGAAAWTSADTNKFTVNPATGLTSEVAAVAAETTGQNLTVKYTAGSESKTLTVKTKVIDHTITLIPQDSYYNNTNYNSLNGGTAVEMFVGDDDEVFHVSYNGTKLAFADNVYFKAEVDGKNTKNIGLLPESGEFGTLSDNTFAIAALGTTTTAADITGHTLTTSDATGNKGYIKIDAYEEIDGKEYQLNATSLFVDVKVSNAGEMRVVKQSDGTTAVPFIDFRLDGGVGTVKVQLNGYNGNTVTWETSDNKVAAVEAEGGTNSYKATISRKASGSAVITALIEDAVVAEVPVNVFGLSAGQTVGTANDMGTKPSSATGIEADGSGKYHAFAVNLVVAAKDYTDGYVKATGTTGNLTPADPAVEFNATTDKGNESNFPFLDYRGVNNSGDRVDGSIYQDGSDTLVIKLGDETVSGVTWTALEGVDNMAGLTNLYTRLSNTHNANITGSTNETYGYTGSSDTRYNNIVKVTGNTISALRPGTQYVLGSYKTGTGTTERTVQFLVKVNVDDAKGEKLSIKASSLPSATAEGTAYEIVKGQTYTFAPIAYYDGLAGDDIDPDATFDFVVKKKGTDGTYATTTELTVGNKVLSTTGGTVGGIYQVIITPKDTFGVTGTPATVYFKVLDNTISGKLASAANEYVFLGLNSGVNDTTTTDIQFNITQNSEAVKNLTPVITTGNSEVATAALTSNPVELSAGTYKFAVTAKGPGVTTVSITAGGTTFENVTTVTVLGVKVDGEALEADAKTGQYKTDLYIEEGEKEFTVYADTDLTGGALSWSQTGTNFTITGKKIKVATATDTREKITGSYTVYQKDSTNTNNMYTVNGIVVNTLPTSYGVSIDHANGSVKAGVTSEKAAAITQNTAHYNYSIKAAYDTYVSLPLVDKKNVVTSVVYEVKDSAGRDASADVVITNVEAPSKGKMQYEGHIVAYKSGTYTITAKAMVGDVVAATTKDNVMTLDVTDPNVIAKTAILATTKTKAAVDLATTNLSLFTNYAPSDYSTASGRFEGYESAPRLADYVSVYSKKPTTEFVFAKGFGWQKNSNVSEYKDYDKAVSLPAVYYNVEGVALRDANGTAVVGIPAVIGTVEKTVFKETNSVSGDDAPASITLQAYDSSGSKDTKTFYAIRQVSSEVSGQSTALTTAYEALLADSSDKVYSFTSDKENALYANMTGNALTIMGYGVKTTATATYADPTISQKFSISLVESVINFGNPTVLISGTSAGTGVYSINDDITVDGATKWAATADSNYYMNIAEASLVTASGAIVIGTTTDEDLNRVSVTVSDSSVLSLDKATMTKGEYDTTNKNYPWTVNATINGTGKAKVTVAADNGTEKTMLLYVTSATPERIVDMTIYTDSTSKSALVTADYAFGYTIAGSGLEIAGDNKDLFTLAYTAPVAATATTESREGYWTVTPKDAETIESGTYEVTLKGTSGTYSYAYGTTVTTGLSSGNFELTAGITVINRGGIKSGSELGDFVATQVGSINVFYNSDGEMAEIDINDNDVEIKSVELTNNYYKIAGESDDHRTIWVAIRDEKITGESDLKEAVKAKNRKLTLVITPENYDTTVSVDLTLKATYKAPKYTLTSKGGTVYYNLTDSVKTLVTGINGVNGGLLSDGTNADSLKVTFSGLSESQVTYNGGKIELDASTITKTVNGKMYITGGDTWAYKNYQMALPYKITANKATKPSLELSQKTVTLNSLAAKHEGGAITVSLKGGAELWSGLDIAVTGGNTKSTDAVTSGGLSISNYGDDTSNENPIQVMFGDGALSNGSYKYKVTVSGEGLSAPVSTTFTVKVVSKGSVSFKTSGSINVLYDSYVDVTPKLSGYTGSVVNVEAAEFGDGSTNPFDIYQRNDGTWRIIKNGNYEGTYKKGTYTITPTVTLDNDVTGVPTDVVAKQIKIKVVQKAVKGVVVPKKPSVQAGKSTVVTIALKSDNQSLAIAQENDVLQITPDLGKTGVTLSGITYDEETGQYTFIAKTPEKAKTYTIKFKVKVAGQASNAKDATVTVKIKATK